MKFEKTDRADEDETITTIVEAETWDALFVNETAAAKNDDRFEPCFETDGEFTTTHDEATGALQWAPGDGGVYTVAEYRLLS